MGSIIRPPAAIRHPDNSEELDPAESILLLAIRWWAIDRRQDRNPLPRLCRAMSAPAPTTLPFR